MKKNNPLCVASFIFGIISILIPIVLFPVSAIILGIVGLSLFDNNMEYGKGYGIAGLIFGIMYLCSWLIYYAQYYK